MSNIDITIGNARVLLIGEIPDGKTGRNKVGASNEVFAIDDLLHAVSRVVSAITDAEVNAVMQTKLTRLREIDRAASKGICGQHCGQEAGDFSHAMVLLTCRYYWINRGRTFSD